MQASIGLSEYVAIGAAPPIQDNITLADYVQVGEYEQDLGMEQDLGLEQDLGVLEQDLGSDFADRHLGGVSRSSMQAPVGTMKYLAPVPPRSFTSPVPSFNDNFDNPDRLYTGNFSGGF